VSLLDSLVEFELVLPPALVGSIPRRWNIGVITQHSTFVRLSLRGLFPEVCV
jgi:hypothetical protein